MELKALEKRSYKCEVRAEKGRDGYIVGRPIVYESKTDLGWFDEVIDRGALDGADLTDVRFLINHDLRKIPLARSRRNNGNSTMRLTPDYEGMEIEALLDIENNADSRSLYSAVGRGDVTGMSFMFSIDEERWENLESDHPTRHVVRIGSVVEVSAVTLPAYEATSIDARSSEVLDSAKAALDKARKAAQVRQEEFNEEVDTSLELEKAKFAFRSKF